MIVYLSGKITDTSRDKELLNIDKFHNLERILTRAGLDVFNPAAEDHPGWSWEKYLARDLKFIYDNRPMMFMMEGWTTSRGARLEHEFAKALQLSIVYEEVLCRIFQK